MGLSGLFESQADLPPRGLRRLKGLGGIRHSLLAGDALLSSAAGASQASVYFGLPLLRPRAIP